MTSYVCETSLPEYLANPRAFFEESAAEAKAEGCTWCRFSRKPDGSALIVEGWKERPAYEGEVRWSDRERATA